MHKRNFVGKSRLFKIVKYLGFQKTQFFITTFLKKCTNVANSTYFVHLHFIIFTYFSGFSNTLFFSHSKGRTKHWHMCKIITSTDVRKMSHSNLYHVSRTVTYGACLINNITELLFFELRKSTSYTRSIAKKLRSMLDWFSLKHADWKNYRVSSLHYFLANIFLLPRYLC